MITRLRVKTRLVKILVLLGTLSYLCQRRMRNDGSWQSLPHHHQLPETERTVSTHVLNTSNPNALNQPQPPPTFSPCTPANASGSPATTLTKYVKNTSHSSGSWSRNDRMRR